MIKPLSDDARRVLANLLEGAHAWAGVSGDLPLSFDRRFDRAAQLLRRRGLIEYVRPEWRLTELGRMLAVRQRTIREENA